MPETAAILVLDTGSPRVSLAIAREGEVLAATTLAQRGSSAHLIASLDELLAAARLDLPGIGGVAALQGPGSFTGLRIGLATALGIHQTRRLPATAIPTLEALALAAPPEADRVLAAVHALHDEWFVQRFAGRPGRRAAVDDPVRLAAAAIEIGPGTVVVRQRPERAADPFEGAAVEVEVLAAEVAAALSLRPPAWDASRLHRPLYLAPAPATLPGRPKAVRPPP